MEVQDRLGYLIENDLLTLAGDAEQAHGTARNAVGVVVHHLDAARQVLAVLEASNWACSKDVLVPALNGVETVLLPYTHFSILMRQ